MRLRLPFPVSVSSVVVRNSLCAMAGEAAAAAAEKNTPRAVYGGGGAPKITHRNRPNGIALRGDGILLRLLSMGFGWERKQKMPARGSNRTPIGFVSLFAVLQPVSQLVAWRGDGEGEGDPLKYCFLGIYMPTCLHSSMTDRPSDRYRNDKHGLRRRRR